MARTHSDETKAAVMAALLAGQSVSSVARDYKIPKGTVSAWKARHSAGVADNATQKKDVRERIGELVLDHLEESLKALKVMAATAANPEWLKGQSASELAVLYGVVADKTHRILEALSDGGGG